VSPQRRPPPLVLVVDDNTDNRDMYSTYLEFMGMRVQVGANGRDALQLVLLEPPDAIVLDMGMPIMDGWEVARRLKADPRTKSIPIVAVTGHALEGAEQAARGAGCDAFLSKPCLPERLHETLVGVLRAHPRRGG
jgi:CheY-like chemotaxis protein